MPRNVIHGVIAFLYVQSELSRKKPGMVWTTLAHHIDLELLREANRLTRKNGAVEVAK
jgi:hypothetical protein